MPFTDTNVSPTSTTDFEEWEDNQPDTDVLAPDASPASPDDEQDSGEQEEQPIVELLEDETDRRRIAPYGPIKIERVVRPFVNARGQDQAYALGRLLDGDKKIRLLISAYGGDVGLVTKLQIGKRYKFRGYLRTDEVEYEGGKRTNYYLDLGV